MIFCKKKYRYISNYCQSSILFYAILLGSVISICGIISEILIFFIFPHPIEDFGYAYSVTGFLTFFVLQVFIKKQFVFRVLVSFVLYFYLWAHLLNQLGRLKGCFSINNIYFWFDNLLVILSSILSAIVIVYLNDIYEKIKVKITKQRNK